MRLHYALRMALENGLDALDAGRIPDIPSGSLVAIRNRRHDLSAGFRRGESDARARDQYRKISRLLDALDGKGVK